MISYSKLDERERESLKWHVEDAFNAPLIKCSFYIFSKINQIEPHIYIYIYIYKLR